MEEIKLKIKSSEVQFAKETLLSHLSSKMSEGAGSYKIMRQETVLYLLLEDYEVSDGSD